VTGRGRDLWWERRRLWLPAAVFTAVAVLLLVGYRVALAGRLGLQASAVEQRQGTLAEVSARRQEAEALVRGARSTRLALDALYGDRLGTQARRLTAVIAEVKALARQAGLTGVEAISYQDREVAEVPLLQKQIVFQAVGGYDELRRFINLLEVADTFLTLEEIRVQGDAGGQMLRLQVRLSTLFATPERDREDA
jgi:Tfp pilus assembly protein PilO